MSFMCNLVLSSMWNYCCSFILVIRICPGTNFSDRRLMKMKDVSFHTHVLKITGKIYRLKQHFLLLATAWRFTKIKLWSDPFFTRKWMSMWKSTKVYTAAFVFMGHSFWKENIEERVKLLESKVFNCCLKITMADLWKIGVKMREWHFRELSSWISKRGRPMSHLPPSPPSTIVHLWCVFFSLPAMNGPFPADLNFRENTVCAGILS